VARNEQGIKHRDDYHMSKSTHHGDLDIAGSLTASGTVPGSNAAPLDDRTTTPVDTDHKLLSYSEQLYGFSKQGGSVLSIDKTTGFLTRRLITSLDVSGGGHAFALSGDNVLYVVSNPSSTPKITRIDPVRDNNSAVANLSFPAEFDSSSASTGMDFHPVTGVLYAVLFDFTDATGRLGTIDVITGAVTNIGKMNVTNVVDALAIDPTDTTKAFVLIKNDSVGASGKNQADLFSLDLVTGAAVLVGDTLHDRGSSLAYDSFGQLYAVLTERVASGKQKLYKIDTGSGNATLVGELFYEEQHDANSYSVTDLTFRRRRAAASEISLSNLYDVDYAIDYGVQNALKVAIHPHPQTYREGHRIRVKALFPVSGSSTVEVNEMGPKTIKKIDKTDTILNDILFEGIADLEYDGTNYQLFNPAIALIPTTTTTTTT